MKCNVNGNVLLTALKIWHLSIEQAQKYKKKCTVELSIHSTGKQLGSTLSILSWYSSVDYKMRKQIIKVGEMRDWINSRVFTTLSFWLDFCRVSPCFPPHPPPASPNYQFFSGRGLSFSPFIIPWGACFHVQHVGN